MSDVRNALINAVESRGGPLDMREAEVTEEMSCMASGVVAGNRRAG